MIDLAALALLFAFIWIAMAVLSGGDPDVGEYVALFATATLLLSSLVLITYLQVRLPPRISGGGDSQDGEAPVPAQGAGDDAEPVR